MRCNLCVIAGETGQSDRSARGVDRNRNRISRDVQVAMPQTQTDLDHLVARHFRQSQRDGSHLDHRASPGFRNIQRATLAARNLPVQPMARCHTRRTGCHRDVKPEGLTGDAKVVRDPWHNHHIRVDRGKNLVENPRVPVHIQKSVRLPMHIGEFGNHIALDRRLCTHHLDFIFQIGELIPLRRRNEGLETCKHRPKLKRRKAILHAVRIGNAVAPDRAGLHPPGLASVGIRNLSRIWQAPHAKFRHDQRLVPAPFGIAERRKRPVRPGGKIAGYRVPFTAPFGHRPVIVIVVEVGFDVEIIVTGRVIHHQPRGISGLQPIIHVAQPFAMTCIFDKSRAPIFVDQRPDHNRWMIAVARQNPAHGILHPAGRSWGKRRDVGNFGPDQHAKPVGHLVIAWIWHFDVAPQQVQPKRLGFADLVLQKLQRGRRADAQRVIILIQSAAHVELRAVQEHFAPAGRKAAKAETVVGHVRAAVVRHRDPRPVECRMIRRPRCRIFNRNRNIRLLPRRAAAIRHQVPVHIENLDTDFARLGQRNRNLHHAAGQIGGNGTGLQAAPVAHDEMDRLPNAADRTIPALLAVRNFGERKVGMRGGICVWQNRYDL